MQEERKRKTTQVLSSSPKKGVLLLTKVGPSTLFSLISDKSPNKFLHHKRGKMTKKVSSHLDNKKLLLFKVKCPLFDLEIFWSNLS